MIHMDHDTESREMPSFIGTVDEMSCFTGSAGDMPTFIGTAQIYLNPSHLTRTSPKRQNRRLLRDLSGTDDEDSDAIADSAFQSVRHTPPRYTSLRHTDRHTPPRHTVSRNSPSKHYIHSDDTDSGISNSYRNKSSQYGDLSSSRSRGHSRSAMSLDSGRSRTGSLDRRTDRNVERSALYSPGRPVMGDHSLFNSSMYEEGNKSMDTSALEDSEMRRVILVDKLRDAKDTIHLQATRLEKAESLAKDASFELDDLKYREKDLQRKIYMLEKERSQNNSVQLETIRARENMQSRLQSLEEQLAVCRSQITMLQAEIEKKQQQIESLSSSIHAVDLEKQSILMDKESAQKELTAIREARDIVRARNEWLEQQVHDNKGELERLRKEHLDLGSENKLLNNKLIELKTASMYKSEEYNNVQNTVAALREERDRVQKEAEQLKEMLSELRRTYTTTSAEKERFVREKAELHNRIQGLASDKDALHVVKSGLEEQLAEVSGELNTTKALMTQLKENKRRQEEELDAARKMSEKLSAELGSTKSRLDKAQDQISSLEQNKKLAFQQYNVYEEEIQSLEKQIDALKKSMGNIRNDSSKDKEKLEDSIVKLKDEVRKLKNERNQMEVKVHELETKLQHNDQKHSDQVQLKDKEIEGWKNDTDKLNTVVTKKDTDLHVLRNQILELESQLSVLKVTHNTYQGHYDELNDTREQLAKLKEENKRLCQERNENQHVIQLLEMQKAILAKTSGNAESEDKMNLQKQLDNLMKENRDHRKKIASLEAVRLELEKDSKDHRDYEKHRLEHRDCVSGSEYKRLQTEKLKLDRELSEVMAKHKSLERQYRDLRSQVDHVCLTYGKPDQGLDDLMKGYEQEQHRLQALLQQQQLQLQEAEMGRQAAEDRTSHLQHSLNTSLHQLSDKSAEKNEDLTKLKIQCKMLEAELQEARSIQHKQSGLISSLKEDLEEEKTKKPSRLRLMLQQSLDEVGGELTQMRTELQKLLEVIQVKDAAIEDLEQQLKVSRQQVNTRFCHMDPELLALKESELPASLEGGSEVDGVSVGEDKTKLIENLRRELKAKDRQVESLEEQLRSSTRVEIKRLKRGLRHTNITSKEEATHPSHQRTALARSCSSTLSSCMDSGAFSASTESLNTSEKALSYILYPTEKYIDHVEKFEKFEKDLKLGFMPHMSPGFLDVSFDPKLNDTASDKRLKVSVKLDESESFQVLAEDESTFALGKMDSLLKSYEETEVTDERDNSETKNLGSTSDILNKIRADTLSKDTRFLNISGSCTISSEDSETTFLNVDMMDCEVAQDAALENYVEENESRIPDNVIRPIKGYSDGVKCVKPEQEINLDIDATFTKPVKEYAWENSTISVDKNCEEKGARHDTDENDPIYSTDVLPEKCGSENGARIGIKAVKGASCVSPVKEYDAAWQAYLSSEDSTSASEEESAGTSSVPSISKAVKLAETVQFSYRIGKVKSLAKLNPSSYSRIVTATPWHSKPCGN